MDNTPIKYNDKLIETSGDTFAKNTDLLAIHLRDARQLFSGLGALRGPFETVFHEGILLLASAALEAHLSYMRTLGIAWNSESNSPLNRFELEFLEGRERFVSEDGRVRERPKKLSLELRLKQVPALLIRLVGKSANFELERKQETKLIRMVARRDALLHPRWDRYLESVSIKEAGEAIDAVEAYLAAVARAVHPYLIGYFSLVYTTPPGWHKNDGVTYAHRSGKAPLLLKLTNILKIGPIQVLVTESTKANLLVDFALQNKTEGDSGGSLLTRLALVRLLAMVGIVLTIIAQIEIHKGRLFEDVELMFLNESATEMDEHGVLAFVQDHQKFTHRVVAIPKILAKGVVDRDVTVNLGDAWGAALIEAQQMRERLLHSPIGERVPRVTKEELRKAQSSVQAYFGQLLVLAPEVFAPLEALLYTPTA
jgi:hypothetical protein